MKKILIVGLVIFFVFNIFLFIQYEKHFHHQQHQQQHYQLNNDNNNAKLDIATLIDKQNIKLNNNQDKQLNNLIENYNSDNKDGYKEEEYNNEDEYNDKEPSYFSHVLNEHVPYYAKLLKQSEECDNSFSFGFYQSWRNNKQTYCEPLSTTITKINNHKNINNKNNINGSKVTCYRFRQPRHSGPDIFCTLQNVLIDFGKLTTMGNDCNEKWGLIDNCARYYTFPEGSIKGKCKRSDVFHTRNKWPTGHFQAINRPIFAGFSSVNEWNEEEEISDDILIIDNPVLLTARDNVLNTYHSMEDFVNAYLVLETLKINVKRDNLQLLIIDQDLDGPYLSMWEKAFSSSSKGKATTTTSDEITTRIVTKDWTRNGRKVLFRNAIVNLPGASSPIVKDIATTNPCGPLTDLFVNFGRHVLKSFGFKVPPYRANSNAVVGAAANENVLTEKRIEVNITIIDRKYHPFRKDAQRKIENMKELVAELESKFSRITMDSISVKTNVFVVDFATIPFEKQLERIYNTQILIGVHGAGLTQMLFMAGGANVLKAPLQKGIKLQKQWVCGGGSVIEIPPLFGTHYSNMASWSGHTYYLTQASSPQVDVGEIVGKVRSSIYECVGFYKSFL